MDRVSNWPHPTAGSGLGWAAMAGVAGFVFGFLAPAAALAAPEIETESVLLVAVPEFQDPLWGRTVLVASPMPFGGHVGLILNRPTRLSLALAFPKHGPSKQVQAPIYFGGPFGVGSVVALTHGAGLPIADAVPMGGQLQLVVEAKLIETIVEQTPNEARYFAGLVIWRPGELRAEIERGLWSLHPADEAIMLRKDTDHLWRELARPGNELRTELSR